MRSRQGSKSYSEETEEKRNSSLIQDYPRSATSILILLVISLVGILAIGTMSAPAATAATQPFSLLVGLTFKTDEALATFKADIAPLASYVKKHEPGTLAYEVMVAF